MSEEIEFFQSFGGCDGGTSKDVPRILRGWKGTLAVLISELEEMVRLGDDALRVRLQQEIDLDDAFLGVVNSKADHPDADSWRAFFEEENEIAQELIKLV